MKTTARTPDRNAFTLVELLVVVGIIAVLAALLTPAVMRARSAARNAAIKVEIDMLHMAIMNYKNEYGSFPPCFVDAITGTDPATRHLRRLFPRMPAGEVPTHIRGLTFQNPILSGTARIPVFFNPVRPDTALVQWLYGFTDNPVSPVISINGSVSLSTTPTTTTTGTLTLTGTIAPRKKLYDFDTSRITSGTSFPIPCQYFVSGKPDAVYVYIDSAAYLSPSFPLILNSGNYLPHRVPASVADGFANPARPFFNPDTFQILCAGIDGTFGTDDDLSNFWKGTRREYLDSLQNQ